MLTATLKSLVSRFNLENQKVGEVAAGAVIKHSRDWNLARESTLGSGPASRDAGLRRAAGLRHQPHGGGAAWRNRIAPGEIECGIAGGVDSDVPTCRSCCRRRSASACTGDRAEDAGRPARRLRRASPRRSQAARRRASPSRAPACRWASTARRWRRSGRSAAPSRTSSRSPATSKPRRRGQRRLLRRSRRAVPRTCTRDNNVRADTSLEKLATLQAAFDRRRRHAHRRQQHAAHRRRRARAARVRGVGARPRPAGARLSARTQKRRRWTSSAWRARKAC